MTWGTTTAGFLETILPKAGAKCVGIISSDRFTNLWGPDAAWVDLAAGRVDARDANAYFALAGFDGEKKRKQANVVAVRSLWLDIDTQENKPKERYTSRAEAVVQVMAFTSEVGMPKPTLVSSGYGLHVYWPMTEDLTGGQWKVLAHQLKQACLKWGLAVDPSRTTDEASVLRPPGTRNHKRDATRVVKVAQWGDIADVALIRQALDAYVGAAETDFLDDRPTHIPAGDNKALVHNGFGDDPSSAATIAERCGVMKLVRDTRGNVDEPTWYAALGVLRKTDEAPAICHEWSDGHPLYSPAATDAKLAQLGDIGPTTCERFRTLQPEICGMCTLNVKSPIVLGRNVPASAAPVPVSTEVGDKYDITGVKLPDGYFWKDGQLSATVRVPPDKNDPTAPWGSRLEPFSSVFFYPVARVRAHDDRYTMLINVEKKGRVNRNAQFIMSNSTISAGGDALARELGDREIPVAPLERPMVQKYLLDWMKELRTKHEESPSVTQFGWADDGFVVGETYITPTGPRAAVLSGATSAMTSWVEPAGTLEAWVKAVNNIYAAPGLDPDYVAPQQFSILVAFAAPLHKLFGSDGGVTVYAYSPDTGYGKTSMQSVGTSAWGKPELLMLQKEGYTPNGLTQRLGALQHLPIQVDELTNTTATQASQMVYGISGGLGKLRLDSRGQPLPTQPWSTILSACGNRSLGEILGSARANTEAEMARVWEFGLTRKSPMSVNEALAAFLPLKSNYGHAGRAYMEYVVKNRDKVQDLLMRTRAAFNNQMSITQGERYWSALHACVLTAGAICKKLGLLDFDTANITRWIAIELLNNRNTLRGHSTSSEDLFAEMLGDMWPGVLVTMGEGDLINGTPARVEKHPHGSVIGRSIVDAGGSSEVLLISRRYAREWCEKRGTSVKEMFNALVGHGWVQPDTRRVSLGKGTTEYGGVAAATEVWWVKMAQVRTAALTSTPITGKAMMVASATQLKKA